MEYGLFLDMPRQAGAEKITQEMISAGVAALEAHRQDAGDFDLVAAVYSAMDAAKLFQPQDTPGERKGDSWLRRQRNTWCRRKLR